MTPATAAELRADVHSIEPIPETDRDSTGPQQMWIWAGANIAPVNWALGALGIVLKLGLWETIAVIVVGNLFGCAIFAAFTVMGHKTGVNQMVLSRSAFGRRGAYLPSALMFLMTLGWIGVNTYFPVKISMAILGQFGIADTLVATFIVITVVMVLQVVIGIYGFYAIRTFEKYTVPPTVAIMVLMSVLAWSQPGVVNWHLASTLAPGAHLAMLTLLMTAIGVGWGISWVTWASDYSRFVPRNVSSTSVFWYSYVGMFVPSVWLAILGATIASVTLDTDPAKMVSAIHGGPYWRDEWGFNDTHQWLANRGYAVLSVNYRGSTGFGKAFVTAADHEWGGKMHDDLIAGVDWAVARGIADPKRIGFYGASYGGYAALTAATKTPEVFACIVDIYGIANLLTFMVAIPPYWASSFSVWKNRIGDPDTEEGRAFLRERSPLTHIARAFRPILIVQGLEDVRVTRAESEQMVAVLRQRNVPVTYVVFPDEGHGFTKPQNQIAVRAVTEAFLAKHLGGAAQPIDRTKDFAGSSLTVEVGADLIPGLSG